jgi:hypothetical protein
MSVQQSVSYEDAVKLGAGRTLNAKIASAAKGERVSFDEMRRTASRYIQNGNSGITLPIANGDAPTGFKVTEPLTPVIISGNNRVGQVLAGSGTFTPTGDAAVDAAMRVIAGADGVTKPVSPDVVAAAEAAGYAEPAKQAADPRAAKPRPAIYGQGKPQRKPQDEPQAQDDPLDGLRQDLAALPEYAPAQVAMKQGKTRDDPNQSVQALIWVVGTNTQLRVRCKRAFLDRDGEVPLLVMSITGGDIANIPTQTPLTVNLVPFDMSKDTVTLQALHLGLAFADPVTKERYLCMAVLPAGKQEQEYEENGTTGDDVGLFGEFGEAGL